MALGAALPSQSQAQVPPAACRSDTEERTQQRLDYLKDLVSSPSSEQGKMRRTLGVKQASAASVRLVRDPRLGSAVPKLAPALIPSVVACTKAPATFSSAPAFPASAGVQVLPSEVRVVFPATLRPDSAWPAQHLPDRFAGAAWQVLIRLDTTWLAAVHQLEPDSALLLPAFVSLDQAVGAGHLRACDLEAYLLVCFRPLRGSAALAEGRVVLHIQESEWTATLLRSRPASARLAIAGNGRLHSWADSVTIEYARE